MTQRPCQTPTATPTTELRISPNSNLFVSLQVRPSVLLYALRSAHSDFKAEPLECPLHWALSWKLSIRLEKGDTSNVRIQRVVNCDVRLEMCL